MAGKKTGKRLLTWVLVLVMALSLLPLNVLAANRSVTDGGSGMNFKKELVSTTPDDDDGTYTIRMTAQATGTTTTTTKVKPMDIVLVLDQSGSMADDFNGNSTSNNEARRQYAMKAAVNSFIGEVAKKYSPDADHRMAIVTFGDNATKLVGWTAVDNDGKTTLTNQISALPKKPSGATNVGAGMQMAENLMNNSKAGTDRLKTVIVFTDGVPTKQRDFDTTVADAAIDAAKNMKDAGVTIYTVGIFKGVDPDELYGKDKIGTMGSYEGECSGTKGDYWQYREGLFSGGDIQQADIAAGNRFLNYLSSNYEANKIGVSRYDVDHVVAYYIGFMITDDPAKGSNQDYYKTASNASSLNSIFKTISDTVPEPGDPALDENTMITDTLSDYFTFATGTADGDVKVHAGNRELINGKDITVDLNPTTKTVTVTGYDFSKHYQGIGGKDEETLVIEIKVKPDTSYTNWGASGEYKTNEGNATVTLPNNEEPIAEAESPKAHVNTYKVTYGFDTTAPDGATHPEDNQYYISGQTADVKPPEPSSIELDGHTYTFNGWKNGEADVGEKIDISGNVTLTGSWSKTPNTASYTVNYLWNVTSIKDSTTDTAACGSTVNVTAPNIDGYTLIPDQEMSIEIGAGENVLNLNYYKNVTLTANSKTVTYDGQLHNGSPYDCEPLGLLPGHKVKSVDYTCAPQTNVGKYDIELDNAKIITADGADVTDLYQISYNYGKLTINKRSVTLTSESASKVYDGMPLTKHEVKVTGDGFADGEGATYNVTGTITNVGTTDNTFTYTLNEGTKATNYTITKTEGKLTITEASAPTPGTFDFNDVIPDDGKVTPAITKTVKGNVGKNFKEIFAVTVTPKSENAKSTMTPDYYTGEAKVIASKSLKDVPFLFKPEAMANAVVPYGKLRFTEAGTYTYTVQEIPGQTSRMSYDTTEYTLTIKVVLNKNTNKYEVESWQFPAGNREYTTALNIVNTYRAYHPSTPSKPTLNTGDHYAYVMGYPDGTVRPNGSITRAEVSAILFRLLSDKTRDEYFTTESSFTDVKAGAWYNNSIATLEKAGVIVDTAKGGAFRPNEAITRAELAAMLAQFSDAKPVKGVKFSDVSAEHWAYEAIAIAAKMGWIEGYPDGTFRPDATITRAEMMTLVNRALERVPSDEDHLLSKRVMLTFPDCKSGDWFYIAVQEATNSHTYERAATEKNGDEQWTALRANRDWTKLEQ